MAKEEFKIIKTEKVDLNFYAVRSQDGKWFRSKGQHSYRPSSWVDNITEAKIYSKPGPAKAQVTFWAKNYPEFGVPHLVRITTGECQYLDQGERVTKVLFKMAESDKRRQIESLERSINNYIQRGSETNKIVEVYKKQLEELKNS